MLFLQYLYDLIIGPIELVFKIIFSLLNKYIPVSGVNILLLSLVFSLVVLPLYMRADKIQDEEREQEEKLGPTIKHIKQYFKGDERFMILQTFYRQNNYSPLGVLKSSVSLLLQVPFFLAAYRMLSNNVFLAGRAFGPIKDLGSPDALLLIGGVTINVLPFAMTAINLISAAVYSNKLPVKSKIQLLVMAALFLVLLYNSPSGMVLYWTCNNLFSLVKNIIGRIASSKKKVSEKKETNASEAPAAKPDSRCKAIFFFSCLICAVYIGFYLPMMTVASAPEEFVNLYSMSHPIFDIFACVAKGLGLFMIWPTIFYMMASVRGKKIMSYIMPMIAASAVMNSTLFSNNFGFISNLLVYSNDPEFTLKSVLLSLAATLGGAVICFLLVRFGKNAAPVICFSVALVFVILGITNTGKVNNGYRQAAASETSKAEFTLSKNGKNVVVIMTDRAVGPMLPYIFNEKKELNKTFDGFVYYHNTASFGIHTNTGVPGLLGGYEYTPAEMNARTDKTLPEKFDEALKLMPTLFTRAGYDATVINPKYAGYKWYPDLSVFDGMENVKAYSTKYSYLPEDTREIYKVEYTSVLRYNLFCYSIFKSAPVAIQKALYDDGNYNETKNIEPSHLITQHVTGNSTSFGHRQEFMWNYYTMKAMNQITKIEDGDGNHYVYFATDIAHDNELLQEPSYEPSDVVDNRKYDQLHPARFILNGGFMWVRGSNDYKHYQSNMAAYIGIGKWLEYLKENGCYDNTRIIIVSDHGWYLNNFPEIVQYDIGAKLDGESFAPILLVKDFDSHGELKTSEDFMTNADTPGIAMKGIIDNPVNPFTGKPLTDDAKKGTITVLGTGSNWDVRINNGVAYLPGEWYSVKDSIWKKENWKYLGKH